MLNSLCHEGPFLQTLQHPAQYSRQHHLIPECYRCLFSLDLCRADAQADAVPEPEGEDFKKAVSVLLPYLLSHRTRLASSLEDSSTGAEDSASAARSGCSLSL